MIRATRIRQWPLLLVAASSVYLGACSSSLPGPPRIAHPSTAYEEVPYPPPAALVEVVPVSPGAPAVWVDGYWTWQGQIYLWRRGGWLDVPLNCYFAEWQSYYTVNGRLMFAQGAWYRSDHTRIRAPEIRPSASRLSNEVTSELQTAR